jgi:hypothetical protein
MAVTKSSSPAALVTDWSTTRAISGRSIPGWAQASRKLVIATLARRTAGRPLPRVSPMSQRGRVASGTTSSRSPPTRASAAAETYREASLAAVTVSGTSRSSALCATRATARTWRSRFCATVRSAEFMIASPASSRHMLKCETSMPGRTCSTAATPAASSRAQPASAAVTRGDSTSEASASAEPGRTR